MSPMSVDGSQRERIPAASGGNDHNRSEALAAEANRPCPLCGSAESYAIASRRIRKCKSCKHQFSATSGTDLHAHKLPVETIAKIREMLLAGMNARKISIALGVQYKTVWNRTRGIKS